MSISKNTKIVSHEVRTGNLNVKCFNFHMFICSVGRADVCLLRSKRVSTHSLRDKGTKGQRDKGTKGQKDKRTK